MIRTLLVSAAALCLAAPLACSSKISDTPVFPGGAPAARPAALDALERELAPCAADADCPSGSRCLGGKACGFDCREDAQCAAGEVCTDRGACAVEGGAR